MKPTNTKKSKPVPKPAPVPVRAAAEKHIQQSSVKPAETQTPSQSFDQKEMQFTNDTPVETLQGTVYNAGSRLLSVLKAENLLDGQYTDDFEQAVTALQELGQFSFNIGFAGEQSSGKSTVINSLLHYPLMPTCQTKTTAVVVQLAYSQHLRVRVVDEDTQKTVLDFDCHMPKDSSGQRVFRDRFQKMLDYGVNAMHELVMETFQPFSDLNVLKEFPKVSDMDMSPENPRHVMILLFVLMAVYVGQNDESWDEQKERLMKKRKDIFRSFGMPIDVVNISIFAQADFDILKSGLIITDLPGLGSSAASTIINGKKVLGHDEITINAIKKTDAMVFLATPENREAGYKVLTEMLSNAKIKEAVYKSDRIIAVLNKADCCEEAQRITILRNFCEALAGVGVSKEPADIQCYCGIAGEFHFEDTPFERTLYFKKGYREDTIREDAELDGEDFEEAKQKAIKRMKRRAEKQYEESGIEELLRFFRTTYVEQGKYLKSTSALQAIRILVRTKASELQTTAENCELISKNHASLQESMVEKIQQAVENPIAEAINQCYTLKNRISEEVSSNVAEYAEMVPALYVSAFEAGLNEYRNSLQTCMSNFDCTWFGIGQKARIDQSGSKNRQTYLNLQEKMGNFSISLKDVNHQYERMLTMVRDRIDQFYTDAKHHLERLKAEIINSLNLVIKKARQGNFSAEEIHTLELLKNQMLDYVEKQLQIVQAQCSQQQSSTTDAMQEVVDAVLGLNTRMVDEFATATKSELAKRLSTGGLFTAKEFILIDGPDGLKTAVNNLSLTEGEKENMRMNLDSNVNAIVMDKIPNWLDDLNQITSVFQKLQEQLMKPMQGLIKSMSQSAEVNAEQSGILRGKIDQWKSLAAELSKEVCPILKPACALINDREPVNINMQDDVFFGCFD